MTCPTGLLVDVESNNDQNEDCIKKKDDFVQCINEQVGTSSTNKIVDEPESKLCGFLTKITTSGLIKTSRVRWFSFHSDTCELFYYRSNTETVNNPPLGKISLRRASFNFTAADLKENIFTVSADAVTHVLQAHDKQSLMWWLQELQCRRRLFNFNCTDNFAKPYEYHGMLLGQSLFWVPNPTNTNPGLLGSTGKQHNLKTENVSKSNLNILPHIKEAPELVKIKPDEKPRSLSVSSSSTLLSVNKLSSLAGINTALINAGEVLKLQANKLRLGRRLSVNDSESTPVSLSDNEESSSTLKQTAMQMHEEMELLKTKLQSKEEVVQLLKIELEEFQDLKDFKSKQGTFSKDDYKLRSELIKLQLDKEQLEQEIKDFSTREKAFQEKISMLEEMLVVKDEVVMQLSNKIYDLETGLVSLESENAKLKTEKSEEMVILTPTDSSESFYDLKDRVEGYMLQNKFLNNEILELANLRQIDAQKTQTLQGKVLQSEAEYCQLNSKYLVLLSEMNKPTSESFGLAVGDTKVVASDKDRKEMLKILIQDAIKNPGPDAIDSSLLEESHGKYDHYGFNTLPDDDTESTLRAIANQMKKRSVDLFQSSDVFKVSTAVKWQNYLTVNKELQRNDEIKNLIRLGVPHEFRAQVWSWIVKDRVKSLQQEMKVDIDGYYHHLTNKKVVQLASKQIELDLLRTLPNNKHFSSMSSPGIEKLRRVLRAYSLHNPTIGYCQGLNRVAAVALLYLTEEEAFWCLVAIVEIIMPPNYYSNTLTASQADQRVFRDLLTEKLPRLHRHFETAGVDLSLITFNWLLCIYCDTVPPETMLHIWDCFLYEGSKVLFRYGLAFFKFVEEEILQITDYIEIFNFLREMSHCMNNVRELDSLAFTWMNPFPMRKITKLRQVHLEKVASELKELEELRRGFSSNSRELDRESDSDDE